MRKIFTLLFTLFSFVALSQSTTVVISQVYGGGGGTTGTYMFDYVELHNVSAATQVLTGYSLQYGSGTGQFGNTATQIYAFPAATSIAPGKYLLIQLGAAGGGGAALPVTPDLISTNLSMSAGSGKVALVTQVAALGCGATATPCALPGPIFIDVVSYGASNNAEGGVTVNNGVALVNTQGSVRKANGCTDTDNNNADFDVVTAPVPRNSSSPAVICGAPVPTLSASPLAAFGNVCVNSTATNSFTLTGTTLTTANILLGAVTGYTYSTTVGGTYTTTLTLTQPGGSYSQTIFVKFSPVAATAYPGNIAVSGGGAPSFNVAVSGTGINTLATVTSGAASAITTTSATVAGSITAPGCGTVSPYGIEYSTISGFANGTGTAVPSTNLTGTAFSSNLSGLTPSTVYYYHAYATNGSGTAYGAELSFTTLSATPALSATTLTGFGNVCTNTTTAANSFTISGTNLTTANIVVGPLAGYSFSTVLAGPYTSSLSLTQTGGTYSQIVYVKFTPTAVQSYNGNIPVSGGGATAINVAATGAGVNTIPTLTTGPATAITTSSATVPGTITTNGCTGVTAYGIEYSTTAGFANGSGTAVPSTNLVGTGFTSALSGLSQNTVYYYHAYATNAGGTGYSSELSFTTLATTPTLNATALAGFGNVCLNTASAANSFTINGSALTTANINVGPLAGYTFSTTVGGTYTATLSITQPGGTFSQQIFVKLTPTAVASYNGNIPVSGGGAPSAINVAATGAGVNTIATVTTGTATAVTAISATLAGNIGSTGCSAITTYGVEYSTVNGFANGSGTPVTSTNLAAGNFTSAVTGLTPSTVYYYHAYATNSGGTAYGAQQTFTTATPSLIAGALTAFGSVCLNTTSAANSFTLTGTNLTTANVTVGALAGFTYSTTIGGTYTATLSLTQPGNAYSQTIFVKFTPTAVQSYNGNIPVGGGGAAASNVAASGAGVNTAPTVTTGSATAVTQVSATLAGTIPTTGCSAITAYGVEYSTTPGFANGTGTAVPSTNLTGVNFTSAVTGLTVNTVYYYNAYATNAGGTVYGSQQTFTTLPAVLVPTALTAFGNVCVNTSAGPNSFTISSTVVSAANINVSGPVGYSFSLTSTGTYTPTLSITHPAGAFSQVVFVMFNPTAVLSYNGNINITGGGSTTTFTVPVSGAGVNTGATVSTGGATNILKNSATLSGSISAAGCSVVTSYGIEYSSIPNFANGQGTKIPASNLASGNFTADATGLVQNSQYYYKAYAITASGIAYGAVKTFTTAALSSGLIIYSNPISRGGVLNFSIRDIQPASYILQIINMNGRVVYSREQIVQLGFMDDRFVIPLNLPAGVYTFRLTNTNNDGFSASRTFLLL